MKDYIMKRKHAVTQVNNKGFSLIELIIVIAIMAVLVAVIAPNLTSYLAASKKRSDESNAHEIEKNIVYIVQEAMVDEEAINVLRNIKESYNGKITRLDSLIADVDQTGAFEEKVKKQLKMNDFRCKREGYNYYIQIFVNDTNDIYEVNSKSIKATENQLDSWPSE